MGTSLRIAALFAGVLLVNLHLALRQGEFASPVTVALEGIDEKQAAHAKLLVYYLAGADAEIAASRPGFWSCPRRCIVDIAVKLREPATSVDASFRVTIGEESFVVPLKDVEVRNGWHLVSTRLPERASPGFATCRNWPGVADFLTCYFARSAWGLATISALLLILAFGLRGAFRESFQSILGMVNQTTPAAPTSDRVWNVFGWLFLAGGFAALQWTQPYYFAQDDALLGELPGILLGCRSLWDGVFPDWNPYVFMGSPLATIGFWAITYPPQLISYAIARHVLADEFATMEVFAAIHLLAGFIAMRMLCRRVGMGAFVANLAALSFVFAGCILIMGRSWHAFIANAVWLPLLGLAIQRFREGPVGWKWIAGVGLVLGMSYHAGFPQIVAILGMFFVAGVVAAAVGNQTYHRLLPAGCALLLGVGVSAPLLLHHLQLLGGLERFTPSEGGVYDGLHGALLPYPLAETTFPNPLGSEHAEKLGHFYFFGGVFAVLFALQALGFWVCLPGRSAWANSWWAPSGIFALLMVLGEPALLWKLMSHLPMAKFFLRYSFRFYPWLAFCAILSGGMMLEHILAFARRRRAWQWVLGAGMYGVLGWHLAMCQPSFYNYGFRPFPGLPREFEAVFHPSADKQVVDARNSRRVASWCQVRSPAPDYYLSLPLNLPHYYQVPSMFGYDPVIEGQPRVLEAYTKLQKNPLAACKAYGVGWHLFSYSDTPAYSANQRLHFMEAGVPFEAAYRELVKAPLKPLAESGGTALKELPGTDPLAFAAGRPGSPLPMRLSCRGAEIDVSGLAAGTPVVVNFLWYPHHRLYLDGEPVAVDKDDWHRVVATLPSSGTTLSLRYQPPWLRTCAIGAAISLLAMLLGWASLSYGQVRAGVSPAADEGSSA